MIPNKPDGRLMVQRARAAMEEQRPAPAGWGTFIHEHPFLTFFMVTSAISGVVTILTLRSDNAATP